MNPNIFQNFLAVSAVISGEDLYEILCENDSCGKILYIGRNLTPNASQSDPTWYIKKLHYDSNGCLSRVQLPDSGIGFFYEWALRATYFS